MHPDTKKIPKTETLCYGTEQSPSDQEAVSTGQTTYCYYAWVCRFNCVVDNLQGIVHEVVDSSSPSGLGSSSPLPAAWLPMPVPCGSFCP